MANQATQLEHIIENLCRDGCVRVSRYINLLRDGRPVPGLEQLSAGKCSRLLRELEEIMAPYSGHCGDG